MSEPLKVSISPKAIRSGGWISPTGGVMSPATSNYELQAFQLIKNFELRITRGGLTTELHGTTLNKGYILRGSVLVRASPWLESSPTVFTQGCMRSTLGSRRTGAVWCTCFVP